MLCLHVAKKIVLEFVNVRIAVLSCQELRLLEQTLNDVHTDLSLGVASSHEYVLFVTNPFHVNTGYGVPFHALIGEHLDLLFRVIKESDRSIRAADS